MEESEWNHMTYSLFWTIRTFQPRETTAERGNEHTFLLKITEAIANQCQRCEPDVAASHGGEIAPLGRSTMFEFDIIVPAMGESASFWRDQFTRSVD